MSDTVNFQHVTFKPDSQHHKQLNHQSHNTKKSTKDTNICDQCGVVCHKPSVLKKHIRKHTNERPYPCKLCDRSFKTKSNLTKHEKSKGHTKLLNTNTRSRLNSTATNIQQSSHHRHSLDKGSTSQRAAVMLQAMAEKLAVHDTGMLESDLMTDNNHARTSNYTGTNSSLGSESEAALSYENNEDTYQHHIDHDYHSSMPRHSDHDNDHEDEENDDDDDDEEDDDDDDDDEDDDDDGDGKTHLIKQEVHEPSHPTSNIQANKCTGILNIQTSTGPISVEVEFNLDTVRILQTQLVKQSDESSGALGTTERSISPSSSTTHLSSPLVNTSTNITTNTITKSEPLSQSISCRNDAELHAAESILHMANQRPSPLLASRVASPTHSSNTTLGNQFISSDRRNNLYSAMPGSSDLQHLISISDLKEDNISNNSTNVHKKPYRAVRPTTLINKSDDLTAPHRRIKSIAINSTNSSNHSSTIITSSSLYNTSNSIAIKRKIESSMNWGNISKLSTKSPLLNSSVFTNSSLLLNPSKPLSPLLALTPNNTFAVSTSPSSAPSTTITSQLQQSTTTTKKQVMENLMKKMHKKQTPVQESTTTKKPTSTTSAGTPSILPPSMCTLPLSEIPSSQSALSKVITNTASLHNQMAKHNTRSTTTATATSTKPPFIIKSNMVNHLNNALPIISSVCSVISNSPDKLRRQTSHSSNNSPEENNTGTVVSEDGGHSVHSEDDRSPQLRIDEGSDSIDEKHIKSACANSPTRINESEELTNEKSIQDASKHNSSNIEQSIDNSNRTCCGKVDDDEDDEEIDVVNTDSGDEQLKSNIAHNDAYLTLSKTKSNGGVHSKRKTTRELTSERAKKLKEAKDNVPLHNPNINAKDLLQDYPLNLSANRQPTIAVPFNNQNLNTNSADMLSSNYLTPDNGSSIFKTICESLNGAPSKTSDNSITNTKTISSSNSPVSGATLSAIVSTNGSTSSKILIGNSLMTKASQPPLDSYQLMYLQPEDKKECSVCSQFVDVAHYKMHMDTHRFTEKETLEHKQLNSPGLKSSHQLYHGAQSSSISQRPDSTSNLVSNSNTSNTTTTNNTIMSVFIPSCNRPRNHKCSVCGVAFRVSGHLRKHYNSKSHLQGLMALGLVTKQLYAQIEHLKVPCLEIVDQTTGNINPEALRRHITNWTSSNEDDRNDDIATSSEDTPLPQHPNKIHSQRYH